MKITSLLFATLFLLTLASCDRDNRQAKETESANPDPETPVKLIEYLVGDWEMTSASGEDSPGKRITFTTEARYIVYDGTETVDSGAYRMNEQLNNIYLESEADENPREYEIELNPRQMTLTPNDAASGQGASAYVYRRVGPASIPPDKEDMAEGQEQ